jgi:hypothetical protein
VIIVIILERGMDRNYILALDFHGTIGYRQLKKQSITAERRDAEKIDI